jgi:arylformamidase
MKYWDISVAISKDLPVWPGDPKAIVERVNKIEDGANANVSRIDMGCHTGTHVDAPFHFLPGTKTVESLSLDVLVGPVQVIRIADDIQVINSEVVNASNINPDVKRILFRTKSSSFWSKYGSQFRTEFVGIDKAAAEALVEMGMQLVGTDYLSVSPYKQSRPTHEAFLKSSVILLEGLDLSQIDAGIYNLICLPLKIMGADGAPARAILSRND